MITDESIYSITSKITTTDNTLSASILLLYRWQEQYAIAFPPGSGLRDEIRCSNAWNYRFNGLENAY